MKPDSTRQILHKASSEHGRRGDQDPPPVTIDLSHFSTEAPRAASDSAPLSAPLFEIAGLKNGATPFGKN